MMIPQFRFSSLWVILLTVFYYDSPADKTSPDAHYMR